MTRGVQAAGRRGPFRARLAHGLATLGLAPDRPRRTAASAAEDREATWVLRAGTLLATGLMGGLAVLLVAVLVVPPALSQAVASVDVELQLPERVGLPQLDQRSVVYAADGSLLAVLDREVSRTIVSLDRVPEHVRQAVITAEDRKFFEHSGYDLEGIGRALVRNAKAGTITQGGSTITQQLAKNEIGSQRTLERKLSELAYAMALEQRFTKEQLLERYLNLVYFGSRAYGVSAAAEQFFGVPVEQLSVEQGALLAGLIRSPNSTDPRTKPDVALARRNRILADMVKEGYLAAEQLPALQATPLGVVPPRDHFRRQPHAVDTVVREFLANPAFGDTPQEREELLYNGGLEIHTTLDPRLQAIATDVIERHFRTDSGPTAAIAAVDPVSGRVLAIQSGLDYEREQYDLATQGRRQPGSAYKPFVYAEALRQGFPMRMTLPGSSPTYFEGVCGWARKPPAGCTEEPDGVSNFRGASFGGLDMRRALTNSVNTAAAQLVLLVGHEKVKALAGDMGVDITQAHGPYDGPGIALGGLTNGVTPLEMASAYGTFANDGIHVVPYLLDYVTDRVGNEMYRTVPAAKRVLDQQVNAAMVDMMQDVVRRGTATAARLPGWQVAGKTGTTQRHTDAWFVGYTPALSAAVWMGHPDGKVPMRGVTGGALPARMWREFAAAALEGVEPRTFPDIDFESRSRSRELVTVPDVKGLDVTDAIGALGEAKLVPDIRLISSSKPRGTVLWQSPGSGRRARVGDTVMLGVAGEGAASSGSEKSSKSSTRSETRTRRAQDSAEPASGEEAQPSAEPAPQESADDGKKPKPDKQESGEETSPAPAPTATSGGGSPSGGWTPGPGGDDGGDG